jgi:hypothetical protein
MEVRLLEIDSRILGQPVIELVDVTVHDELRDVDAAYVFCKVPIEELSLVHHLESSGFQFVETQFRLSFRLSRRFDVPAGYRFERQRDARRLQQALDIARTTFTDDRWTIDPELPRATHLAGERFAAYVEKSFERTDERLYCLLPAESDDVLAIKTHRINEDGSAVMLLGGVHPAYKGAGIGPIASFHEYNALLDEGVTRLTTHVSARNYAILNLEVRSLKYRIEAAFVVLRKVNAA